MRQNDRTRPNLSVKPNGGITRMRSKTKAGLLFAVVLWLIAMIVWPGCATPPLPASRKPIAARKKQDFAFLKSGQLSRSDMVGRLGEPDEYFSDLRVACYRINQVTGRKLWLFLGVVPVGVYKFPGGVDVAFIQFDEHDRAQRFGIGIARAGLHYQAKEWLAGKMKEQRDH